MAGTITSIRTDVGVVRRDGEIDTGNRNDSGDRNVTGNRTDVHTDGYTAGNHNVIARNDRAQWENERSVQLQNDRAAAAEKKEADEEGDFSLWQSVQEGFEFWMRGFTPISGIINFLSLLMRAIRLLLTWAFTDREIDWDKELKRGFFDFLGSFVPIAGALGDQYMDYHYNESENFGGLINEFNPGFLFNDDPIVRPDDTKSQVRAAYHEVSGLFSSSDAQDARNSAHQPRLAAEVRT